MMLAQKVPYTDASAEPAPSVVFTIPGRLPGWQRTSRDPRRGHIYTPRKTQSAEAMVRWYALKAMKGRFLLAGPVRIVVAIWLTAPASWSKKDKANAKYVTGKPDVDNVLKLVADALNGMVWKDDSQIAQALITRRYSPAPERVDIMIKPLEA